MTNDFAVLLEESIRLELQVANLYLLYKNMFPEDADFWGKLMLEEVNHASILRSLKECFAPVDLWTQGLLAPVLVDLQTVNGKLTGLLGKCREGKPPRAEAFWVALELEQSAGELHFQEFMETVEPFSELDKVFKRLNGDDRDHAKRIRLYMASQGISEPAGPLTTW